MKKEERKKARQLRREGWAIQKISVELGVAKSSVSVWVRDIPQPEKFTKEYRAEQKRIREEALAKIRQEYAEARRGRKVLSGDVGRWLLPTPAGYKGTTLINGYYVYEHRYLMEQKLGRLLRPGEVVHHLDGDRLNNNPENLEATTNSQHTAAHNKARGQSRVLLCCPECRVEFDRRRGQTHLIGKGTSLTFCSRSCSSKFYGKGKKATVRMVKANVVKEYKQYKE